MSALPIRVRLTLPFAAAMAIVLAASGVFVYLRVGQQLLDTIDSNLRAQLTEVQANAGERSPLVDQDASLGPTVAAVELPSGGTLAREPATLATIPVRASDKRATFFTSRINGLRGEWRIAQRRTELAKRPVVIIVARSLDARDETLDHLAHEFLFAAPAALVLAILAGYGLAAGALRPVEAMRRRAADVSAHETGQRLPLPAAQDELRALALTLNDMLARLESAFEHERRFVSDASHELRTPLSLLRAELDLALRRTRSREELEHVVRSAAEETERLSRLADDLLLVARSDQGRLPIRLEPVELPKLVTRVRDRFALRAEVSGRKLVVEYDRPLVVSADPLRVEQALGNLVDNAFVHGAGTITVRVQLNGGLAELHVRDEGPGFPPNFESRAFERFSRGNEARSGDGSGLGLAIVALIARAHGGDAHLRSRENGGADVWITLPQAS
jgi:signal transduction histidine kinase